MKATMTAACLATVCALAASAQTQGQGQTQQTPPQQRADAQQTVTLSGCLERDTMAATTAATAGQQQQQQQQQQQAAATQAFKLTDVTVISGEEHLRQAARAGQTGQQQQQQQQQQQRQEENKEFRLSASAGVNLSQHVGHEVEVVGRVVSVNPSAMTTRPATTGQTGQTGQTQAQTQQQREEGKDKAPLVMVNTIKMTATTCR